MKDKKNDAKRIYRVIGLIVGTFILALNYNLFLLPNNLVIGGTSGLSIIFKDFIDPTIFIYVATFILLIVSFVCLGYDDTRKTIVGSLLYPVFVTFTKPIAAVIIPNLVFEEFIVTAILTGVFYGVANGIIFKTGFTTGGTDVIIKILTKYLKTSEGKSSTYMNAIIILIAGFSFGLPRVVYAFFVLFISTYLIDKIMIGISDSKVFYIYTKHSSKIRDVILEELKTGYTILPTLGGYSHDNGELIMCVVNTNDYYYFKELVLNIDPDAFLLVNDCYDVNGGVKKKNLPFI